METNVARKPALDWVEVASVPLVLRALPVAGLFGVFGRIVLHAASGRTVRHDAHERRPSGRDKLCEVVSGGRGSRLVESDELSVDVHVLRLADRLELEEEVPAGRNRDRLAVGHPSTEHGGLACVRGVPVIRVVCVDRVRDAYRLPGGIVVVRRIDGSAVLHVSVDRRLEPQAPCELGELPVDVHVVDIAEGRPGQGENACRDDGGKVFFCFHARIILNPRHLSTTQKCKNAKKDRLPDAAVNPRQAASSACGTLRRPRRKATCRANPSPLRP